jgi:hypothetical protein
VDALGRPIVILKPPGRFSSAIVPHVVWIIDSTIETQAGPAACYVKASTSSQDERELGFRYAWPFIPDIELDMPPDLKRINALIVSVAYLILDEGGLLIESRLRQADLGV